MGNQQPTGRTRSDTYTRYERDGEDGRYVTLDHNDSTGNSHLSPLDGRVILIKKTEQNLSCVSLISRSHHDQIKVYQYVYVINVKCNNSIFNKLYKLNYKVTRKQYQLCLNIQLHQKIKKLYYPVLSLIGKRR